MRCCLLSAITAFSAMVAVVAIRPEGVSGNCPVSGVPINLRQQITSPRPVHADRAEATIQVLFPDAQVRLDTDG